MVQCKSPVPTHPRHCESATDIVEDRPTHKYWPPCADVGPGKITLQQLSSTSIGAFGLCVEGGEEGFRGEQRWEACVSGGRQIGSMKRGQDLIVVLDPNSITGQPRPAPGSLDLCHLLRWRISK